MAPQNQIIAGKNDDQPRSVITEELTVVMVKPRSETARDVPDVVPVTPLTKIEASVPIWMIDAVLSNLIAVAALPNAESTAIDMAAVPAPLVLTLVK